MPLYIKTYRRPYVMKKNLLGLLLGSMMCGNALAIIPDDVALGGVYIRMPYQESD